MKASGPRQDLVDAFMRKYPELYRNHPGSYYAGKCSIVSVLFAEMRHDDFGIKDVVGLWGYKKKWDEKHGKNGASHVAVLVDGYVYDMTYAQISQTNTPHWELRYYDVRPESQWKRSYDRVERRPLTKEYCTQYKKDWTSRVKEIMLTTGEQSEAASKHYNDLHSVGYI